MTEARPTLAVLGLAPLLALTLVIGPAAPQATGTRRIDSLAVAQARDGLEAENQRRRLEDLSAREAALTADLARRRGELSRLFGVLAAFQRQPPPALAVPPERARNAVRGAILARSLTPELTRRAQSLSAELSQVALLRREAAAANEALLNAQSAQAERTVTIAQALQAPDPLDGMAGPPDLGDNGPMRLTWPVPGRVTQRYGETHAGGGKAQGMSIAAKSGAIVTNPAAGVAQFVGPAPGWGIVLILKIKGAYHLVLGGLDEVSVQNGQTVAAGAPVGRLPSGGGSTPELYMEVRENGAPADPARWLSGAPLGVSSQ